jgi:hypothetical protein
MKIIRYIAAAFGFLLVGVLVDAKVTRILIRLIPPAPGETGWTWRNLFGIVLGLVAGVAAFRLAIKIPQQKPTNQWFAWVLGIFALLLLVFVGYYLYLYL